MTPSPDDPHEPAAGWLDPQASGDRLEHLLGSLRSDLDLRRWEQVEAAMQIVTDLYGTALERVLEFAHDSTAGTPEGEAFLDAVVGDDLVASLLIVHGLHPDPLDVRVARALDGVRPYLASHGGDVEVVEIDEEERLVRLRLLGSCDGCPSSAVTLQRAVEDAIEQAAPELTRIEADGAVEPVAATSPVPIELGPTHGSPRTAIGAEAGA